MIAHLAVPCKGDAHTTGGVEILARKKRREKEKEKQTVSSRLAKHPLLHHALNWVLLGCYWASLILRRIVALLGHAARGRHTLKFDE